MKQIFIATLLILSISTAQAQWLADGSVINNFQMTDINNQVIDAYQTNASGKHLLIDFSATWCGNCWNYHNSKVLENYYKAYGPSGSMAQDAQVVFYESDASTNANDITGIGTSTVGDWTQGVTHPICNEAQPTAVYHKFLANPGGIGFPSVVVLCENNRYYRISTSLTQVADLRTTIINKCGSTPLSTSSIQDIGFEYDLYPNPSNTQFSVDINLEKAEKVAYTLSNTFGQTILHQDTEQRNAGLNKLYLSVSDFSTGLYLFTLQVGERTITEKIMIVH